MLTDVFGSPIQVVQPQFKDPDNTTVITNTGATYTGTWALTRPAGVVRARTVLASDVSAGLGGMFTFEFSEDAIDVTIDEVRPIGDFATVRSFDLLNYGTYYRVVFTPSRTLSSSEHIYITTQFSTQYDGEFVRLADQPIEKANAAMGEVFAFLQGFDPLTGKSVNIPPPATNMEDADNAATPALTASQVWTGNYKEVNQHGCLIYLYAVPVADAPASVVIEYSDDQSTVISTSAVARTDFVASPTLTYAIYLVIANGIYGGQFARPKITNKAVPQSAPGIALFARSIYPFNGSFGSLNSPLTFFSQALLTRSVLAGQDPANGFNNVGADKQGNLFISDRRATYSQSGALFFEGVRDDVSVVFSRDRGDAAIASLVSGGGTSTVPTHDTTEGQAVFAVSAAPGEICYWQSEHQINYESGHMIRVGQTIQPSVQPTGDGKIIWGVGESDGAGHLINAIGYEYAADGLFAIRIKGGAYAYRQAQLSWNRDTVSGQVGSQYTKDGAPVALDPLKNGIYEKEFEWYGAAPPVSLVTAPYGQPIVVDVEETVGQMLGTTVPEPNMRMFVRIRGDHTTGQAISVRSGSWRGGILTNKTVLTGSDPNGVYGDLGLQGRHLPNCTTTLLNGDTGGSDNIWRGEWFGWQGSYVGLIVDVLSDVPGTIHIDFSAHETPVNGSDVSVDQPSVTYPYSPSEGLFRRTIPVQSRWVRIRVVNGPTAQSIFSVDTAFLTSSNVQGMHPFSVMPTLNNLAAMTQAQQLVLAAEDPTSLQALTGTDVAGGLRPSNGGHDVSH